jgi:hypothetical protein
MLAEYPNVLRRLRAEILEKVGSVRRPTYDDLKEMKYLRAVINGSSHLAFCSTIFDSINGVETLRLYPPVCVVCSPSKSI